MPDTGGISASALTEMRSLGLGLVTMGQTGLVEVVPPADLSLNISLPPLDRHSKGVRREFSKVHQKFGRGEWKEGFEAACKVLEKRSREYLTAQAQAGILNVPGKKGVAKPVSIKEVQKMPMGALKDVFCNKLSPNQIDALLCSGLKRINPDRIQVAHAVTSSRLEQRLRNSVGRHMWTIDNLLRKLAA